MNPIVPLSSAAALAAALFASPGPRTEPAAPACCVPKGAAKGAPASLDLIRKLEGEWVALDAAGKPTEMVVSVFEPTAGGSAIIEKLFPGADEEMLSIYSVDDGALVLAHYCVMGNQPRYAAEIEDDGKKITWRCQGGGNLKDHDRAHMHEGKVTFVGPDRMDTEWTALAAGERVEHVVFKLQRKSAK